MMKMTLLKIEKRKIRPAGGHSKVITLPKEYSKKLRTGSEALIAYTEENSFCLVAPKFMENRIAQKLQELQKLLTEPRE